MADLEGSISSEDGSEPMEVNIPPEIARELGQDPTSVEEGERVVGKPRSEEAEGGNGDGVMEDLEEDTLDLKKIAADYAQYLAVNSRQDKQLVDDRIESVVLRVDEFKKQLETMHGNLASSSEKMQELHEKMRMLKELFKRIDQVEAFLGVVGRNVEQLEEGMSKAEKELDPNKLRKVFSALPGLRRSTSKPDPTSNWQPPKLFKTRDYFSPSGTASSPVHSVGGQARALETTKGQQVSAIIGSSDSTMS